MAILAPAGTRVLIHGAGSPLARFQCEEMLRHGTRLVGIVGACPPEFAKQLPPGLALFETAQEAIAATGGTLSMVFNPPLETRGVVSEAIDAGIEVVICLTEHVPVHDAIHMRHLADRANVTLVGPNSSGLLSPGIVKAGFFVEDICIPGDIGVVAKSGSLAYAVLSELKSMGLGITTVVAIGADVVKGTDFRRPLALFQADPDTRAMVLLGEIGGDDEEKAAEFIRSSISKPVVAFVAGRSVPLGQSMGHAAAIARRGRGDYASKIRTLRSAGAHIAGNIGEITGFLMRL